MRTKKLKIENFSKGYKLQGDEEHQLSVTFRNNRVFTYFGKTKKECEQKFKNKFGSYRGFIKKEWTIFCP